MSTVAERQSAEISLTLMPAPQKGGHSDIPCLTTRGLPEILGILNRKLLRIEAFGCPFAEFGELIVRA